MKMVFTKVFVLVALVFMGANASSHKSEKDIHDGLNVIVTSADAQTQMMAMVLSTMTLKKHNKHVNMTLCGPAGALADKEVESTAVKMPNGKAPTPKMMMMGLIEAGAKVEVCPLYLPNAGKDKSVLVEGVSVAKPPMVAKELLNEDYNNLTF